MKVTRLDYALCSSAQTLLIFVHLPSPACFLMLSHKRQQVLTGQHAVAEQHTDVAFQLFCRY